MTRFPGPTHGPDSWKQWLAHPEKHWKAGYSAWALAHSWEAAGGFPPEIVALLATDAELRGADLRLAIPEYQVELPGGTRPSQTDLLCVCRTANGLATLAIEGKVDESFGETVDQWLKQASDGKRKRLDFLCSTLGLRATPPGHIRYQLLHRAASAVIEAQRFHATHAVIVVHHFAKSNDESSFQDFVAFGGLYGQRAEKGRLVALGGRDGVGLSAGWAEGELRFLR